MYKTLSTDGFLTKLDKSKPSIFFDIDHTVIYPVNKKKLYSSKDSYGWVPNPNAKKVLKKAISEGFTVYFVTNQLKYDSIVENRLIEMLIYLEIDALILIADQRNIYRKPSALMIQDRTIPGGIPTIDPNLSFYCGDAAGRRNDFSDDDLWFAHSANLRFYLPEEVFDTDFDFFSKKTIVDIPRPPILDKELINNLKYYYETSDGVMLVGLPGTGKSSIRKWYIDNFKKRPIYVYNNDENLSFPQKKDPDAFYIFDNTNLTNVHRQWLVGSLDLRVIYIDLPAKEAIRGVKYRNIFQGGEHIPDVVIHTMNIRKEIPEHIDLHLKKRPVLTEDFPLYLN